MTEEERREIARNSYAAQMEMLGYEPDGNPKDMVDVVRCRNCKHRFNGCCYNKKSNRINFGVYVSDNWYCADGERR